MITNPEQSPIAPRAAGTAAHPRGAWLALAALVMAAASLSGCLEANTLGDEPPDEVQVGDPPTWDNGMQELMTLKCGVCHQVPLPKHAPEDTPDEYDFTVLHGGGGGGEEDEDEIEGAADALEEIQDVVRDGEMPLDFATPLTDDEKDAIFDWDGT